MEKENKEKKHFFRKFFIFIFLLIICLVLYSRYLGTKGLVIKEYKVESEKLPSNFSGVKIVHLSDIYYQNTTFKNDLNKLKNKINILKPDIIVFTGNLFSNDLKLKDNERKELVEFMSNLDATIGKYAVRGKSDFKIDYEEILKESNFTLLDNSYELIYYNGLSPIFIAGVPSISKDRLDVDKVFEYYKKEEETIIKPDYKIILSSDGNAFTKILNYDKEVSLLLGGASLNGSVLIPFYGPLYIPKNSSKYYAPHYKLDNYDIFISSGIGTDNIKFRFNNKPSFNLYRLKSI